MNGISDEIVECKHPVRFDADTAKHGNDGILKLVKCIVEVINGGGVEVELLLQMAQRLLERFFVLINDVVFEGANESLQVRLKSTKINQYQSNAIKFRSNELISIN